MKGIYRKLFFLSFYVLSFVTISNAQRSNGLTVEGRVSVQEGLVQGAVIEMVQDGRRLDNYGIGPDGRYKVELNYNHKFELNFVLRGNYSQKILVDTNVPRNILQTDPLFPPFPVNINLFTEIAGIDKSFSENPVLKIYYRDQIDNFVADIYYNDAQIKRQIDQAILQSQMVSREADYLSKLTKAELAEMKKEFDQLLKEADAEYGNEKFLNALDGYKAANKVFPNEQYPKDRIDEINDLLGLMMVANEMDKALSERFNALIIDADQNYNALKYFEARNLYQRALSIRPADNHANQRVKQINDILIAQQVEQQYQDLIMLGNNAFNEMLYEAALGNFNEASDLKPNEEYPKAKIREINQKLSDLSKNLENQKSYEQAIFQAEQNFERQFYDKSLGSYENALNYKPGDPKATTKIAEIRELMNRLANLTMYDKLIDTADKNFKKNLFAEALTDYQKAADLLPDEAYPAQQIVTINEKLNADASFLAVVNQADQAFADKQYQNAIDLYNRVLALRSNHKHSSDRIVEINRILASLSVDENYNTLIADADQLFTNRNYDDAKNKYTEASAVKSREQYPKDKIVEINTILRDLAAVDQKYQQAITRADNLFNTEKYGEALPLYVEAGTIKPNETYPPEMISKIEFLLEDQARLLAQKEAEEKARLEAITSERDKNYQSIIDEADRLAGINQFVEAVGKFRSALDVKPNEQYPIQRIEEIRGMIARQQEIQDAYKTAIAKADAEFAKESFETAKTVYNIAKSAKSDETYPDEMIARINSILESRAQLAAEAAAAEQTRLAAEQAEKDRLYNEAIAKADGLFNGSDYENARNEYRSALTVKPEETYPQQKIEEIGTLLAQFSAAQKAYEDAIAAGDREFGREAFDEAKTAYNTAKSAKSDETYPDEMIARINSILESRAQLAAEAAKAEQSRLAALQAEKDRLYNEAIAKADGFFNVNEYENARNEYRSALTVKPEETYPQQKISEINALLEQQAQLQRELGIVNQNYANAIQVADNYFRSANFTQAKENYIKALGLKPNEEYPKQKITEIDGLLQQQQVDEEYRKIILAADGFFNTTAYNEAKIEYEKALNVKPNEQYPKNQIQKINDIFQKEQDRLLAEQRAAADLERRKSEIQQQNEQVREQEIVSQAGLDGLYNDYIREADTHFDTREYNVSRGWYYKAWDIKPKETYPQQRIDEINRLVSGMLSTQRDRDYQNYINLGDSTFRDNQIAVARGWYNQALSIKANETYPREQLNEIERLVNERLAGRSGELFNEHVEKAATAFETGNISVARFWYKKALELRPDDATIKSRLNEIEEALK